ncbi:MAG TPA: metallophosphoesterase family protein [Pseudobacteroides sp.]|uniref:metallophosphoesterase family protein n=1 Tax=Pseudobacteroides sp. TaxID=1968840 RepID=UPI002F94539D
MRFAVLGDVHSNIVALENVLKDIDSKKVDFVLSTGDLVGYLPFPNEVVEMVRKRGILSIQGNHDKYIGSCVRVNSEIISRMSEQELVSNASAAFTNMTLTDENRRYLRNMPSKLQLTIKNKIVLLVHGSPERIDEYVYDDVEKLKVLAEQSEEDIIICGHTHIPFHREIIVKHFINAGSVGKPKHGNANATYVIVDISKDNIFVDIIEVKYEVEKIIKVVEQGNMFDKKLCDMLLKGY